MLDEKKLALLSEPFDPSIIEFLPQAVDASTGTALALAYVDPREYQRRLDAVDPGWQSSITLTLMQGDCELRERDESSGNWGWNTHRYAKVVAISSVTVCGVTRMATGEADLSNPNCATSAEAQAFKRACAALGLGRYLYDMPRVRVPYDVQGHRFPPHVVAKLREALQSGTPLDQITFAPPQQASTPPAGDIPPCPVCGKEMWDNRPKKQAGLFKANSPDFRCKDKNCPGAIWPPRQQPEQPPPNQASAAPEAAPAPAKADVGIPPQATIGSLRAKFPERVDATLADIIKTSTAAGWTPERLVGHIAKHYGVKVRPGVDTVQDAVFGITIEQLGKLREVLRTVIELREALAVSGLEDEDMIRLINQVAKTNYTEQKDVRHAVDELTHEQRRQVLDYLLKSAQQQTTDVADLIL
jgi:hypothetical protein